MMHTQTMATTAAELDVFECSLDGVNQIEASAGTGKTWNICALYVRLLLEKRLAADAHHGVSRQVRREVLRHADGAHAGASSAVGDRKSFARRR